MRARLAILVAALAAATGAASAATETSSSASSSGGLRVEAAGPNATASATRNGDSVVIAHGDVMIDGEHVPAGAIRFRARSGRAYVIDRANGCIAVYER